MGREERDSYVVLSGNVLDGRTAVHVTRCPQPDECEMLAVAGPMESHVAYYVAGMLNNKRGLPVRREFLVGAVLASGSVCYTDQPDEVHAALRVGDGGGVSPHVCEGARAWQSATGGTRKGPS